MRLIKARKCGISVLFERAYSMKAGRVWSLRGFYYMLNEPAEVRRILTEDAEKYPKSLLMGTMLQLLIGNSIFVSQGKVWRRQRRMMDPAFENARIRDVFPQMLAATQAMEQRLDALVGAEQREIGIDIETTHIAADIIFRTIFSTTFGREEAEIVFSSFTRFQEIAYAYGIARIAGIPAWLMPGARWRAARAARRIRVILDRLVRQRYDAHQAKAAGAPTNDILAALLEARDPDDGTPFAFWELAEQIAMLFLAGHETSASGLAWSLYLIAACPHIQDKLLAEAEAVLGEREPRFSDMKRLAYCRDVFREALRLYPPVAFLLRDASERCPVYNKTAEAGETVIISPWLVQRHRELWERPDEFDPDRFSTPAGEASARCAYLPFSQGPRVCIGAAFALQEATLVLASLVRRFEFALVPGHTPEPVARLTLRSENGVRLLVRRRAPRERAEPAYDATPSAAAAGSSPQTMLR
ncbi:cytochrome P450 [Labrys wisconsinensis]|uniref:Cytochrome P450 n=1 Tax=Labrys wisconsinensis TaxID=425677 RepID=A0ABU0J0N2_9HYPH|nr:cytochrome P450 [Labrys wisconsinensis]MDQ0467175.1 cytochrome P450 [Labrys wisconsinensis]